MKQCTKCGQFKPFESFRKRGEGKSYGKLCYQHCKQCEREIDKITRLAKKECKVPKSKSCDICGCTTKRIVFDHDHRSSSIVFLLVFVLFVRRHLENML